MSHENEPGAGNQGQRAAFDRKTGEVHGSGSGAGGENPGEDYDSDVQAGGGRRTTPHEDNEAPGGLRLEDLNDRPSVSKAEPTDYLNP
ncbi:hypothetical protein [Sphingosinicella rhizophila]|uniref:Uncharacterized protein n=1 Tax=Sphingosinicella rhizophila TaxID=3050082 RepID=A0ABU3Q7C1_9SPHN|nr:hypothetical protein [Sphingosinicella sp. GR2756]MDT9599294.1 hypothetical protein [Sphingosinicella sp. GR2756]